MLRQTRADEAAPALHVDPGCRRIDSYPMQKCVERVEALPASPQNLLVGQSFSRPAFEDSIKPDALGPFKFFIVEIGVVNHLADFLHSLVPEVETFHERFEGAIVSAMRKITVKHVERDKPAAGRLFGRENKLRLGIDEFPDQPGRTNSIDFRTRTSNPSPVAIIAPLNFCERHLKRIR